MIIIKFPEILKEVKKISKCNNIFISGAAQEYGAGVGKDSTYLYKEIS